MKNKESPKTGYIKPGLDFTEEQESKTIPS